MDWWKAKHPEVPVIVKTAWCRLAMNTPAAECWVTYHPDFPANGGEGVYNAYPKTDFHGKPMPECRVHADAECARLNAEREAYLRSLPGGQMKITSDGTIYTPAGKITFHEPPSDPRRRCWRCGLVIDENESGWEDDSTLYPTMPPQYAHAKCPAGGSKAPQPPISLVARHCRTCGTVLFGREGAAEHEIPTMPGNKGVACVNHNFGPEVVVAVVPW